MKLKLLATLKDSVTFIFSQCSISLKILHQELIFRVPNKISWLDPIYGQVVQYHKTSPDNRPLPEHLHPRKVHGRFFSFS